MTKTVCMFLLALMVSTPAQARTWFADRDGDGFGNSRITVMAPAPAPAGYVGRSGDCNDRDATINRGAMETWYDGIDQDCDRQSDYDQDEDGYDSVDYGGNDCDDTDPTVITYTWYQDTDGDGYGDPVYFTEACAQPAGYVVNSEDCNDYTEEISPVAFEYCDGTDNNCNGTIDEGGDWDGDGYTTDDCGGGTDCNDLDAEINPGAPEVGDWVNNDCDADTDEDCDWSCSGYYDGGCVDDFMWWYYYGGDVSYQTECLP